MSKRILIVDDDQTVREVLQDLLESEAYEVETAHDGLSAWEKLSQQRESYEMILLDLTMPRMSGIQLIHMLEQQEDGQLLPIIILSADSDAIQKVLEMGMRHILAKPFDLEKVLALVALCREKHASPPTPVKQCPDG